MPSITHYQSLTTGRRSSTLSLYRRALSESQCRCQDAAPSMYPSRVSVCLNPDRKDRSFRRRTNISNAKGLTLENMTYLPVHLKIRVAFDLLGPQSPINT